MTQMKHPKVLDQIAVVLVRPEGDGNVGQVARAMKNFGLSELRLVKSCEVDTDLCRKMATSSYQIVEKAAHYESLPDALADRQYTIGASRRTGKFRPQFCDSRALPGWLLPKLTDGQTAALVFGNEACGLDNEELDLCGQLVEIETDPGHRSLNLAQAVLVLAYELFSQTAHVLQSIDEHQPAQHQTMERMFAHMRRIYLEVGFLSPENPEAVMRAIRQIYNRAVLDERDVRIMHGILQDTEWYINHVMKKGERDGYREVAGNGES